VWHHVSWRNKEPLMTCFYSLSFSLMLRLHWFFLFLFGHNIVFIYYCSYSVISYVLVHCIYLRYFWPWVIISGMYGTRVVVSLPDLPLLWTSVWCPCYNPVMPALLLNMVTVPLSSLLEDPSPLRDACNTTTTERSEFTAFSCLVQPVWVKSTDLCKSSALCGSCI
jgi:hypothetical protein